MQEANRARIIISRNLQYITQQTRAHIISHTINMTPGPYHGGSPENTAISARGEKHESMAGEQRAEVPRRLRAITSNWTNWVQLTLTGSIGRPCQCGHTAILSGRHTYDVKKCGSRAKGRSKSLLRVSSPFLLRSKYTYTAGQEPLSSLFVSLPSTRIARSHYTSNISLKSMELCIDAILFKEKVQAVMFRFEENNGK